MPESCWRNFLTRTGLVQHWTDFCGRLTLQVLQTGSPAVAENVQPAQQKTLATLNCSLSAKKMRLELIEAYVRSLGKPVSRRRRCTESFTRTWNFSALRRKGPRNWPKQTKSSCLHTAAAEKVSRAQTLTDVNVYELLRRHFSKLETSVFEFHF